jgi:hydroxymethylpyrimidine pyrophosphatase-like HAD family hydrolase
MHKPIYIFDFDGVINDIHTYNVDNRVLGQISKLLNDGCYVALNTGRGYAWVEEGVIDYLKKQPGTPDKLNRVFVSVEMGGLTVEFVDGVEHHERTAFSLLPEQIERARQLYEQHKVEGTMEWYDGKLSMATIVKPAGVETGRFLEDGRVLTTALKKEFSGERVKVKHNPDAIDVTAPEAGKWAGAQLIYDWLQRTPAADFTHFICLGDNVSDYEMARFFGQQGHTVDFIFTGEDIGDVEHDDHVNFVNTRSPYNQGTYEFLRDQLEV